jgi:hypothetical protein
MRLAQGQLTTTDGPLSESMEVIGGRAIFEADSKAEAKQLTTEFLDLHPKHLGLVVGGQHEILAAPALEPDVHERHEPGVLDGAVEAVPGHSRRKVHEHRPVLPRVA